MQDYISFSEASCILKESEHAPFLLELKEENDNELHITICCSEISEDTVTQVSSGNMDIEKILAHCKSILPNHAQEYEIIFENYIIYQVRNESFCSFDPEEIRDGKYLIVFEKSKLLDYLLISTDAQQFDDGRYYPGCWKHYGIYTQNHIVDVISTSEPIINMHSVKDNNGVIYMLSKLLQQIYCQNSNDFSELLFNIYEDEGAYTIDAEYDEKLIIGRDENIVVGDKADSWESILDQVKKELAAYFKSQKNHYKNIKTIAVGFVDGDLFYIKKSRKKRSIPSFCKEDFYDFDALKLKAWLSVYLTVEAKEQYQEERWNTDFDSLTEEEFKYWCEILADNFDYSKYGK